MAILEKVFFFFFVRWHVFLFANNTTCDNDSTYCPLEEVSGHLAIWPKGCSCYKFKCLNEPLSSITPRGLISWILMKYIDCALLLSFTLQSYQSLHYTRDTFCASCHGQTCSVHPCFCFTMTLWHCEFKNLPEICESYSTS